MGLVPLKYVIICYLREITRMRWYKMVSKKS